MYAVLPGVRTTRNEDGGIVLDIDQGQMFRLNPVGAWILESLTQGLDETEIAQEMERQYRISSQDATADLHEFIKSLEAHHLVCTVGSGNRS